MHEAIRQSYHMAVKNLRRAVDCLGVWFITICKALTLAPASGAFYSNDGGECGCGSKECGCREDELKEETE